jgi:hypothetical protein
VPSNGPHCPTKPRILSPAPRRVSEEALLATHRRMLVIAAKIPDAARKTHVYPSPVAEVAASKM